MQDFNYFYSNCIELTFELSCCKYPEVEALALEWKLNLKSMLGFIESAQMGLKGLVIDGKTGRPLQGTFLLTYIILRMLNNVRTFFVDWRTFMKHLRFN